MSNDCACWYLASTSRPQGSKQATDGDGSSSKQPYEEVLLSSFYRRRIRAREVSIPPKVAREVSGEQWLGHAPSGKLLLLTTGLSCLHSFLAKTACFPGCPSCLIRWWPVAWLLASSQRQIHAIGFKVVQLCTECWGYNACRQWRGQVNIQAEVCQEMGKRRSLSCCGIELLIKKQMLIFASDRSYE